MTNFSKSIASEILTFLTETSIPRHVIERRDQVKCVVDLLEIESGDSRIVVIHGKPGIGKTTLAKLVFDQLSPRFHLRVFLEDIEEASKLYTPEDYLEKQIEDILARADEGDDVKGLVVLDDVFQEQQIEMLASKLTCFGSGSRIIITTDNKGILSVRQKPVEQGLEQFREVWPFKMKKIEPKIYLEWQQKEEKRYLEFFSWHAFRSCAPPTPDMKLFSEDVINYVGHNPLILELLGSFLHRKSKEECERWFEELKNEPRSIFKYVLEMIYGSLDAEAQKIFLDIACFFVNKEKTNAIYMWEACRADGFEVLQKLSLVKIFDENKIWMHSEVRKFGRKKVISESKNIIERTRIWQRDEALEVLKSKEEKKNAEAICLGNDRYTSVHCTLKDKRLKNLQRLRFLQLYSTNFVGDLKGLLKELKWLSWHHCPPDLKVTKCSARTLAILDLSCSCIEDGWQGWSKMTILRRLKVLDLTGCRFLTRTPVLSGFPDLERLILKDCKGLGEIDSSIGELKLLKYLNVKGCDKLKKFPDEVCQLEALMEIVIGKDVSGSFTLPEKIDSLKSLVILEIANVILSELPNSIGELKKLERLSLLNCLGLNNLPGSICALNKLDRLSLSGCEGLSKLPGSIGDLSSLTELDISRTKFTKLPNSVSQLKELKVMKMESSCVLALPPDIGSLIKLEELHAQGSHLKEPIPSDIGSLSSLKILNLSSTQVCGVPIEIERLSKLETLNLEKCHEISQLPPLPTGLKSLRIASESLQNVADLSSLENLTDLMLIGGTGGGVSRVQKAGRQFYPYCNQFLVANWINDLSQLENLELSFLGITDAPASFIRVSKLKSLDLCCRHVHQIPELPPSLLMLSLRHCKVKANLSNLKNLSMLRLYNSQVQELEIQELGNLVRFFAEECIFRGLSLPKALRIFYLCNSDAPENVLDLSNVKNLRRLELRGCRKLREIQGFKELKSLEELIIHRCCMITKLEGYEAWINLKVIELRDCEKLEVTEKLEIRLKSVKRVTILSCKSETSGFGPSRIQIDQWFLFVALFLALLLLQIIFPTKKAWWKWNNLVFSLF